eukprot:1195168-Prorocentrum_minimum.AAC.2
MSPRDGAIKILLREPSLGDIGRATGDLDHQGIPSCVNALPSRNILDCEYVTLSTHYLSSTLLPLNSRVIGLDLGVRTATPGVEGGGREAKSNVSGTGQGGGEEGERRRRGGGAKA